MGIKIGISALMEIVGGKFFVVLYHTLLPLPKFHRSVMAVSPWLFLRSMADREMASSFSPREKPSGSVRLGEERLKSANGSA